MHVPDQIIYSHSYCVGLSPWRLLKKPLGSVWGPDRDDSGTLGAKFSCMFTPAVGGHVKAKCFGSNHSNNNFPCPTPSSITITWNVVVKN